MPTTIQSTMNGPLKVEGDFIIQKADGAQVTAKSDTVFLCRCGKSRTQPFCDGSHKTSEFVGD
jgi:CDGSH-type Zn-finger protein